MKFHTEASGSAPAAWQSEELFRQLVKGAKDYAIFMLDLQGAVVSWNTGAELITGYSEAEIVGQDLSVFYTDEDIACNKHIQGLAIARTQGRIEDEGWRKRKDVDGFLRTIAALKTWWFEEVILPVPE